MTKMNRLIISLLFFISCSTIPRVQYEGERNQEGEYHGKGQIIFPNGEVWEGEFKDGEPYNGKGIYVYPNGDKYDDANMLKIEDPYGKFKNDIQEQIVQVKSLHLSRKAINSVI